MAFASVLLLALPALGVHAWMAWTFPAYLSGGFGQNVVFAFAWCGLLICVARWRLLHVASVPLAFAAYLVWLFLVLGEGVSYYLQAATFNARFFANLNLANLQSGLRAFPAMIGGGLVVFALMVVVCLTLFMHVRQPRTAEGISPNQRGPAVIAVVILVLTVLGVDSSPRQMTQYLVRARRSMHFADTPQGQAVAKLLDLDPVSKKKIIALPGKNVVWIYMESLERVFWNSRIFPGLTPNLDRLRQQGLDFSGFETFTGASYTMAGIFASQCGVPLFTSAFAGIDYLAGNNNGAEAFQPKIACFGDVLHSAGYNQIFMGGALTSFSNKGMFFDLHGYDQALGLAQLEGEEGGNLPESGWGLYDSALFPLALKHYEKLEAAGKPFNLTLLTLDTHPPDGRPSPGCPKYSANSDSMLQAVHCTDALIGKFVEALKRQPGWKNTVVVIMSDHLMMRNDAETLFPASYHRRPSLLVLNAGNGVRPQRIYHMDIAPTLLDLMGVRTNASFIAGQDRAAPNAAPSELVDDDVTDAVLRKALWSRANEFALCKKNTLLGWTPGGFFEMGGRTMRMMYEGGDASGTYADQLLAFFVDSANAKVVIADPAQYKAALANRGGASVMTFRPLPWNEQGRDMFSVDWLGHNGAVSHIATVPRLFGLRITSSHCAEAIARADAAPAGTSLDLSGNFKIEIEPLPDMPVPPASVSFGEQAGASFERGYGWTAPSRWGSYAIGPEATLGFRLPGPSCHGADLTLTLDPYLTPTRPALDTEVWVNGRLAATWRFRASASSPAATASWGDDHALIKRSVRVAGDAECTARVSFRFLRPGPAPRVIPADEDPRAMQLRVTEMGIEPPRPEQ